VIDAVDENAPVDFAGFYRREWPVRGVPAIAAALHDAGFDIIAARERRERSLVDQRGRCDCALHEKRALLPMTRKEGARSQAAEQFSIHRGDYM
jgi:hypothetical protein